MGIPERDSRSPTINTFLIHSLLKCYSEEDRGKASTMLTTSPPPSQVWKLAIPILRPWGQSGSQP